MLFFPNLIYEFNKITNKISNEIFWNWSSNLKPTRKNKYIKIALKVF